MTRQMSAWAVRVAAALTVVGALVLMVPGLGLIAEDLGTQGEELDGLGTYAGLLVCGVALIPIVAAGLSVWLLRRRPVAAAAVLVVLGSFVAGTGALAIGAIGVRVSAPMVLGGLLVAGIAFGAALGSSHLPIHSPDGDAR